MAQVARFGKRYLNQMFRGFGSQFVEFTRGRSGHKVLPAQEILIVPRRALSLLGDQPGRQQAPVTRFVLYGDVSIDVEQGDTFAWNSQVENMRVAFVSSFANALKITHAVVVEIDSGAFHARN